MKTDHLHKRIKPWILFFIFGLTISGLTAIPLVWEVNLLHNLVMSNSIFNSIFPDLPYWIARVNDALSKTDANFPFMFYGTDWLAFGHIVIAIAFIGPLKDPARNVWVIDLGIIACVLVIPWAMLFGAVRGIPLYWRFVDISFGVIGILPLLYVKKLIKMLPESD